jgi:uncharacterized protein YecE (DUF72 family)
MDFGRTPGLDLDRVDFALPPDDPRNTLRGEGGVIRCGAPVWNVDAWVGGVYPPGARKRDYLRHYAARFTAVELNATFYALPSEERIADWTAQVAHNPDFRFCPKIPKDVSHAARLDPSLAAEVGARLLAFGPHLGPCLLQLHERVAPDRAGYERLERLLGAFPAALPVAVELRHPGWFEGHRLIDAAFHLLADFGAAAIVTDVAGRRDVLHTSLPVPRAFVRLAGNAPHPSDARRAAAWAARLQAWCAAGLADAHLFVHEPHDADAPPVIAQLEAALGREPPRSPGQLTLF